jgi:hypothetical protein
MRVHVLKSVEVSMARYEELLELLDSIPGPISFVPTEYVPTFEDDEHEVRVIENGKKEELTEVDFPDVPFTSNSLFSEEISVNEMRMEIESSYSRPFELEVYTWNDIFEKCLEYRRLMDVGDDEFVVLITDNGNEYNWFTGHDLTGERNLFVQSSGWGFFTDGQSKYPVAYHAVTGVLRYLMVDNLNELTKMVHRSAIGCMNDLCIDKKDVMFKMRTGDICAACINRISKRGISPSWVSQLFGIMESTRTRLLFRDRFEVTQQVSRISIRGIRREIYLIDFGNAQFKFTPLEKTVYFFFLNHAEGVEFNRVQDYYQELLNIYSELAPTKTTQQLEGSIAALCNPMESSLSEKVSKIRSKIISVVGDRMSEYYTIAGENSSPKRIGIDRELVVFG